MTRSRRFLLGLLTLGLTAIAAALFGVGIERAGYPERALARLRGLLPSMGGIEDVSRVAYEKRTTVLQTIAHVRFSIGEFHGIGGAIAQLGDHLLFATPKGLLGAVVGGGTRSDEIAIRYLDTQVPMGFENAERSVFYEDPLFNSSYVRVADILVDALGDGSAHLYVSHHVLGTSCIAFVVSRISLHGDASGVGTVGDWERIFEIRPCVEPKSEGHPFAGFQIGGRLWKPTAGKLLLVLGDQEYDGVNHPTKAPMDDAYDLGKLLEIDLAVRTSRVIARGFRNPQGLVVAGDGTVWATEHGPNGGDELNLLQPGRNYGWPEVTLGRLYGFPSRPWPHNPEQGRHRGYERPKFSFVPSIGISNVIETDSDEFPAWRKDLLVASLSARKLFRVRRDGSEAVYAEPIKLGSRLRDSMVLDDGRIALLTDAAEVILLRRHEPGDPTRPAEIEVSGHRAVAERVEAHRRAVGEGGPHAEIAGRNVFNIRCASCHRLRRENDVGPHLVGVVGRRIGSVEGFAYSDALAGRDNLWSRSRLISFLSDPDASFRGTSMPHVELAFEHWEPLIDYLERFD